MFTKRIWLLIGALTILAAGAIGVDSYLLKKSTPVLDIPEGENLEESIFVEPEESALTEPEEISEEEAINLVKNLPEVNDWLNLFTKTENINSTTGSKPIIECYQKKEYIIHVYEQLPDHTATFNWYSVDSKTGEIERRWRD